jgi:hypothetical protein
VPPISVFIGTPIEGADVNTPAVFGQYVDIYDISQAVEVAEKVKANASIDWTIRESARAKLMVLVKRTLKKYGYPPDLQQKAVDTVLKQAELLADYFVKDNA